MAEAGERARLLRLGFGDVMGSGYDLPEVEELQLVGAGGAITVPPARAGAASATVDVR